METIRPIVAVIGVLWVIYISVQAFSNTCKDKHIVKYVTDTTSHHYCYTINGSTYFIAIADNKIIKGRLYNRMLSAEEVELLYKQFKKEKTNGWYNEGEEK